MATVTSAFQGITTPISQLYDEIHTRGWQVTKVNVQDGRFVATAKNPQGETVEKVGRDQNTALAALLMYIMRREYIRQGAWTNHWADKLEPIAQDYAKAPHFDPQAAAAWKELADDCVARAAVLSHQLQIEVTHDPEPYSSPQELWEDVQKNRHLSVSDAATEHPVWTRDQVIAFRICHDVLGHAAAGGDFGWTGENLATAAHMPYLTPNAQHALFAETVGQAAYNNYYRGRGPQKITLLKDHLSPLQDEHNPPGHGGEHPSMTLSPGVMPTRSSGAIRDPNYGYETNIVPPAANAVTLYDDPLEHMKVKDQAHALDTGWANWKKADGEPDLQRMKIAVTNAFRAALLSPLKTLQWNATQYQDLSHIPHDTDDPKVYWDALESARINHNKSQGFADPEIRHKSHYPALLDFYRYYARHNPHLNPSEVRAAADREVQIMQAEIEEAVLAKSKDTDMDIIEPKVYRELAKRLKIIVKDDKPLHQASAVENPYNPDRKAYGGWIGRHLIAIAQVAKYADILTEAALEDVKRHDGTGHTFRATTLRLGIPYVGPKVVSFAWLLLQPLTSQLATVDSHMAETLGYKYKDVANNRDYFRLERELMAGRDAAGYGHMPLGQFQWGLWDYKRTGPGSHQDHTPLKPYEPTPHHQVLWATPEVPNPNQHKPEWIAPEWWNNTQPYRDAEREAWSHDVAVKYPKGQVPWQDEPVFVPHTAADDGTGDEVHLALEVPEWVRKKIAEFVGTLNISPQELLDPNEYHITVAYAPHGVRDLEVHTVKNSFNLTGLRFESKALKKLGDAGALVVELHNDDFDTYASAINDWLEDEGIEVSRYDDGFTPHITVAYIDGEAPSTEVLPLAFRAGGLSFSTPRAADKIPSLWAKHLAHRLAAQHFECSNCHHDYGLEPPDTNLVKYCPGCGTRTTREKYNPAKGDYEYVPTYRVRHDPNQMTIQQGMPTDVKYMPKDERKEFDSSYTDRLTLAYDSQNNVLYVGPTGTWHQHAGKYFGINVVEGEYGNALTDNDPNFYVGAVFLPNLPYDKSKDSETHELMKTPGANVKWYHRTPPNAEQIEKAMGLVVQQIEEDEDFDWEDDDDNETGADPSKPKIMGELPIGTTWSHAGALWKVTENDQNFTQMIVVDAQGNKVSGPYHYPPSLAVPDDIKLVPNVGEQPKPKTMGEAPVGSLWQDGEDGPVYKIADEELGTTYTELYIDSYGHKQPPGGKVPNNSNSVFPPSWVPYTETEDKTEGDNVWGQFPEGTQVYYIYKPGVWTVVDVSDDTGAKDDPDREWMIENNVSKEYKWVKAVDLHKAQSNHPEFDGMKDEPQEDEPQTESPFKVGDYVHLDEEWQEQQNPDLHDIDTTPYKVVSIEDNGNVVAKDPFDGSLTEGPPHAFQQTLNEPELLGAQEAHGDPIDPSGNVHAVFAHGTDGKKFRISPWTSWDDAQEQWDEHQNKLHVPFDAPTGGTTVRDKKETDPNWSHNVAHYGVRSGDDPAYRDAPRGDINHPPQPFKAGQKVMVGESLGTITGMGDGPGYWKIQFTDGSTAQYYQTGITQYYQTNPGQPGTFSRVLRRMGLRGPMAYHERPEMPQRAVSAPLMGIPVEYRQRLGYSKALEEHDAKVKAALSRIKA